MKQGHLGPAEDNAEFLVELAQLARVGRPFRDVHQVVDVLDGFECLLPQLDLDAIIELIDANVQLDCL